ncbi:MAG TPA: hypothetical protein VKB86_19960 [Pyrinomonadaceae bacterium]|nr:hypothetical protein [Pyrinomonadaceae bacterium]
MSIANELSGEIATAVLSNKSDEETVNRNDLKDVLIEVHSTLRHLTKLERERERRTPDSSQPSSSARATGAN